MSFYLGVSTSIFILVVAVVYSGVIMNRSSLSSPTTPSPPTSPYIIHMFARKCSNTNLNHNNTTNSTAITLALHMTVDRKDRLVRWCQTWQGPISLSIFIRPQDNVTKVRSTLVSDNCIRRFANIHIVQTLNVNGTDMMTHYPFNIQRNVAMRGSTTDLVFLLDTDFVLLPEGATHDVLSAWIQQHVNSQSNHHWGNSVYIVPAFETVKKGMRLPQTVEELRTDVSLQRVTLFYGHYCYPCHHPTDSRRWLSLPSPTQPYEVFFVEGFEPYVIASKSSMPAYDERFFGRGWDKMSFFYELYRKGVHFMVLPPPYFIIHGGRGDMPTNYTDEYMARQEHNKNLWNIFKSEIDTKYNVTTPALPTQQQQQQKGISSKNDDAVSEGSNNNSFLHGNVTWISSSGDLTESSLCSARRDVGTDVISSHLNTICNNSNSAVCRNQHHNRRVSPSDVYVQADWLVSRIAREWSDTYKITLEAACARLGKEWVYVAQCETTTPTRCVPKATTSHAELQSAVDYICAFGVCPPRDTVPVDCDLRCFANYVMTLYYLVHRCVRPDREVCNFGGSAEIVRDVTSWADVLIYQNRTLI